MREIEIELEAQKAKNDNENKIFFDVNSNLYYSASYIYAESYKFYPFYCASSNSHNFINLGPHRFMFRHTKDDKLFNLFVQLYILSIKNFDKQDDYF